ncbi:S-layer homology domain-containing protein [Natronincola peptidivorans]|uniref:S-layer homology domain-containing protein n=1 Tax=Natronincola peptidivorans TaxID=426128 RepID=A0A1H9YQF7_9FIRM|nr:S-layer homology domain-containing protein [Natronincola peptidivorans]SES71310.1 S-layer homology domain-containing protein [Natronincola peptidivorans]
MKITKREKFSIFFLVIVVFLYGYFRFLVTPQLVKLENVSHKKQMYQERTNEFQSIDLLEDALNKEITNLVQTKKIASMNYFPALLQDELILLINDLLSSTELLVKMISFSPIREEALGEVSVDAITVRIDYEGDFTSLSNLLEKIWSFQRKIIISNLTISSGENEILTGSIDLNFYRLSSLEVEEGRLYDWFLDENHKNSNPFRSRIEEEVGMNYIYRAGDSQLLIAERYRPFNDINGHWAQEEIDTFGHLYYIRGDRTNNYYPDESITRGEFILLLDRVLQWEELEESVNLTAFEDYQNLGSYENAIAKAIYKAHLRGFIIGYMDNTLRPQDPITYREVEMVMRKVLEDPDFNWQQINQKILREKGIHSNGIDYLGNPLTKAEAIYFLYHL